MSDLEKELSETTSALPEVSPVAESLRQKAASVKAGNENSSLTAENKPLDKPRRGRPPKVAGQEPKALAPSRRVAPSATETQKVAEDAEKILRRRKRAAKMVVSGVQQTGHMLGGDVATMSPEERTDIVEAVEEYMTEKEISDIPPIVGLLAALGMYYGRVLQTEVALPKAVRAYIWIENKIARIFSWRKKRDARPNSRNDDERQNDASEKTGQNIPVKAD